MRNVCGLLSVLWLISTGCTYNPVRFDPVSGFQTGGGVGVLCGGPLDPWMNHCGPGYGCGLCGCLSGCCCDDGCHPACPPAAPICAPVCPAPICAPVCPAPVCQPTGIPFGAMPMPGAPFAAPGALGGPPTPTFAAPCPTCGPTSSVGVPAQQQQVFSSPYPGMGDYSQLFQAPPLAPPAAAYGNQFFMPTPLDQSEIPTAEAMPPHFENMDTPAGQEPTPATIPPMNATSPMPQAAPMNKQPIPAPMPEGPEAMRTQFPQITVPTTIQQGDLRPGSTPYIDSRHQTNHLRL